jgi:hypothetical protein
MNKKFYKLGKETDTDDIIDFFNQRLDEFALSENPKFYFQANTKQKKSLIKISKIAEHYQEEMDAVLLVQVNPEYFDAFNSDNGELDKPDNLLEILFDQEIDKINIDGKTGKVSIKSRALNASRGIIDKYSFDDVARAEEIESLYENQKKDAEE